MRRDRLEIGVEREYALYAGDAYLLANDRLLERFDAVADLPDGWRVVPEYSRCLVEVASPPVTRDGWPGLLHWFAQIDRWLAHAAEHLGARLGDGLGADRFVTWDGEVVADHRDLLLDASDGDRLVGPPGSVPACLGDFAWRAYAAMTSTNATIHPPITGAPDDEALARYGWELLRVARDIAKAAPDPARDALIAWAQPDTAALLATLDRPRGAAEMRALAAGRAYSCRPRLVEGVTLFELRCFSSRLPLAQLAPLLDVELV